MLVRLQWPICRAHSQVGPLSHCRLIQGHPRPHKKEIWLPVTQRADVPWLCMPQKSCQAKQRLGEAFRVEQCPMLVVIDPNGNVVTTEGVETMDYRCRYC